ncbi:MAG: glycosylasparaginase, partial [Candidatus Marinimicrobia bacterium]|nr:glycosylasparaginase [Candidatus Neomarinimicrobiota bacterium]
MKRRNFLKTGAIGLVAPTTVFGNTELKTNKNNPILLSTWNHGLPANEAGLISFQNG